MKPAVFATILATLLAGCNRGFSPKAADKRQADASVTDQEVPFRDASNGNPDAEVAIALEPEAHLEEMEPASRATGEDADANHDKWTATAKDKGLNLTAAGPTVRESSVPYGQLDTDAEVPIWTHKDLVNGFAYLRDIMLTKADAKGRSRRLTWLYPDDGCYARAALGGFLLKYKGFKRPFNVFSFGNLSAKTTNHPQGYVNWGYHVAPLVEVEGVAWVLDPAIESTRPVTLNDWLSRQTSNVNGLKVAICDSGSMNPNGLCRGGTDPAKAALGYIQKNFFNFEEKRQTELGRIVEDVLGLSPPWRTRQTAAAAAPACAGKLAAATITVTVGASHLGDSVCVDGAAINGLGASRNYTSAPLCDAQDSTVKVGYCGDAASTMALNLRGGTAQKLSLP